LTGCFAKRCGGVKNIFLLTLLTALLLAPAAFAKEKVLLD
jgi:hypothetical protein